MVRNNNPAIVTRPASLVLVGEISHTLRAQGNPLATGMKVDGSSSSPVIGGAWKEIPQTQIGILDYSTFVNTAGNFKSNVTSLDGTNDRTPWNLVGAVSLDAVFCPYNNFTDSGRAGPYMPYWTEPSSLFRVGTSKTLNPFDPFNQLANLKPTGNSLSNDPWVSGGHNISMALNYNPLDSGLDGFGGYVGSISGVYPSGSGSPVDFYFEKDHWARKTVETQGVRGVGFKSPMVLTGWGYDVNNLPVPARSGTPTLFHQQASWNPHLWKSGPVDLRWDEQRGVWTTFRNRMYLVKITNLSTPPSFSFEVDRSNSRDQYSRNAPTSVGAYSASAPIYDPEYLAYNNNPNNTAYYEQLDYAGLSFPFYEAFIIREADESSVCANNYYAIWTNDCQDCGHITNQCGGGHGTSSVTKKILIENPLRQSFDVGDLAFTIYTGRQQQVNTGSFTGGTGAGASGTITTDSSGNAKFNVALAGSGYTFGGFGIVSTGCKVCTNLILSFNDGVLTTGILNPSGGFPANQSCGVTVYPNDATVQTELLPIHWVLQSEFKSQQVVTHVECDNGILQTCTLKIQTQGYKTCEWCGEDTALINN
jgi:hypothetical protein